MNIFKQILDSYKEKEEILIALPKSENLDINHKLLNNRSLSDRYPEMAWNEFFIR